MNIIQIVFVMPAIEYILLEYENMCTVAKNWEQINPSSSSIV